MNHKNLDHAAFIFAVSSTMMWISRLALPEYRKAVAEGRAFDNVALDVLFLMLPALGFGVGVYGMALSAILLGKALPRIF
ncbi:hypothetical protein OLZ32_34705 [Rhizobium sp. 1AS11]|uniref:hypothetical protein n=1 Tax=Rhizobium acaciae TaxID=2989736 RepID=UPI002222BEEE|nr:hypothetical protein [Rhizobium acaciae]MCW1413367.1 hypothetical protein [Rhizobium acaciae]MCW1745517.1 hypothetical protein [Rhizobium acaciae]